MATYFFRTRSFCLLCLSLAYFSSSDLLAQTAPVKQWDKTFGGNDLDQISCLKQTSDGGFILGGSSNSGISGDKSQASQGYHDYWVVKLDTQGNKLWDKTFGGNNEDFLFSIQQTSDGGYILGGFSESGISGDKSQASKGKTDYWIVRLDIKGNKLWDKAFGGNNIDILHTLQQTSDGGFILGGWSASGLSGDKSQASKGGSDYWIVKLDVSGNKLWDKTFGGNNDDGGGNLRFGQVELQQTSDSGYILGGISFSDISGDKSQANKGESDFWVVKLDTSGNKLWDKTIGGEYNDYFYSLQQTSDGGYILGGTSESGLSGDKSQPSKGGMDQWVVKIDAYGNKQWDKSFGGSNYDWLYYLSQTPDGGYIAGGVSYSGKGGDKSQPNKGESDFWIVKLDSGGNKIWDASFGGSDNDALISLQKTSDGGFILGGYSESGISGDKSQLNHGPDPWITDYWILKLKPEAIEKKADCPVNIFPNPSQGKLNLHFCNFSAPEVEVTVFDLVGRLILRQVLKTTENQLSTELTLPVAKSIYLLQVKAGAQIITRKIVVE
jgi:hypothetical protein